MSDPAETETTKPRVETHEELGAIDATTWDEHGWAAPFMFGTTAWLYALPGLGDYEAATKLWLRCVATNGRQCGVDRRKTWREGARLGISVSSMIYARRVVFHGHDHVTARIALGDPFPGSFQTGE